MVAKAEDALWARVRESVLARPDTSETMSWGHPNLKVGARTIIALEHYGGEASIAFLVGPELQDALMKDPRFFLPRVGGKYGWICMRVQGATWREARRLIDAAFDRAADLQTQKGRARRRA